MGAGGVADDFIRRKLEDAGHGGDGPAQVAAGAGKEREDKLSGGEARLTDHAAKRGPLAKTAGPIAWELSGSMRIHGVNVVLSGKVQRGKFERRSMRLAPPFRNTPYKPGPG